MVIRVFSKPKYFIVALCLSLGACSNPPATPDTVAEIDGQPIKPKLRQDTFDDQVSKESVAIKVQLADALITSKVKAALRADATLAATDIQVNTAAGIVTLTGHVQSLAISEKASEVSRNISDVKQVTNSLIIST